MGSPSLGSCIDDYAMNLSPIGNGGFASVYRGNCKLTGKEVAIKKIDKQQMAAKGMLERMVNEVKIHFNLKHPSILEVLKCFEDANNVYMVLEYCPNGDISSLLKRRRKPFSEAEGRRILKQVIEGAIYLHSLNIMHRDLKLANILLTANMDAKIADFGLAIQLEGCDEMHFTLCGTPSYIAPEIAKNHAHRKECDIWSIGCMLYTMLVGEPPFGNDGVRETLHRVAQGDFEIPCDIEISWEARDLLASILKKDPMERLSLRDVLKHPFMIKGSKKATPPSRMLPNIGTSGRLLLQTRGSSVDSGNATMQTFGSGRGPLQALNHGNGRGPMKATVIPKGLEDTITETIRTSKENIRPRQLSRSTSSSPLKSGHHSPPLLSRSADEIREQQRSSLATPTATSNPITKTKPRALQDLVPHPLSTERLKPITQETRRAHIAINGNGTVILICNRSNRKEKLTVSRDGDEIMTYVQENGSNEMRVSGKYTYADLPRQHWKKYQYMSQFVGLVRSRTPKVIGYTDKAKLMLMDNQPNGDFEAAFYDGTRVTISSANERVKCVSVEGVKHQYTLSDTVPCSIYDYHQQALKGHREFLEIESINNTIYTECVKIFPLTVGRRHPNAKLSSNSLLSRSSVPHNRTINSPIQSSLSTPMSSCYGDQSQPRPLLETRHTSPETSSRVQSKPHPPLETHNSSPETSTRVQSKPHPLLEINNPPLETSTQVQSKPRPPLETHTLSPETGTRVVFVDDIGWATKTNDYLTINFNSGEELKMNRKGPEGVEYKSKFGERKRYQKCESIPFNVKQKLEQVPKVLNVLMNS